ncbi:MAG TPA: GtrA family protein [Saprospiraceae bacterium]|nr:GtrA family protein [Saprospiraceae bacterium]
MKERVLANKYIAKYRKNTFIRSVSVSVIATLSDYVVSFILHHIFGVNEVYSTAIGSVNGAFISFYLNRWWAFKSRDGKLSGQAVRYILTLGFSIFLNSLGVYFFAKYTQLPFVVMRVLVTVFVGVFINYPLYKNFVFKVKSND